MNNDHPNVVNEFKSLPNSNTSGLLVADLLYLIIILYNKSKIINPYNSQKINCLSVYIPVRCYDRDCQPVEKPFPKVPSV